jgi:hypothetical protein
LKFCYTILGPTSGAGSTIAFIPLREKDSQNFLQLTITTSGFKLRRRVNGTFTDVKPDVSTPLPHGTPGQEIMGDFVEIGSDFYLYALNPDLSRGPLQYHWHDSTYPVGVNISYYTSPHWAGTWDFVRGQPLDNVGMPHQIHDLTQDARNHPSVTGAATFDDSHPASGSISDITNRDVATVNVGLPSGMNYTYSFHVNGSVADSGYVDYRDPGSSSNEKFWQAGWYRLKVAGTKTTIQRFTGSGTAGQIWTASSGGAGSYLLVLRGSDQTLYKNGTQVLHANDGGPSSGVRVRFRPGNQTWSFKGTMMPLS